MSAPRDLLDKLRSLDEPVRRAAIEALTEAPDLRALPELRRVEGTDESGDLRFLARKAILALAGTLAPGPEGRPRVPALDDPDPEQRVRSVTVRAVRGKPEDVASLDSRVGPETDLSVKVALALGLGAIGGKAQVATLDRLLAEDDPSVRMAALEGLGLIRDPSVYPYFVRHARDVDAKLRAEALARLRELGRAKVVRLCLAMTLADKPWMVSSALSVLAGIKDPEHLSTFEKFLDNGDPLVRTRAREGLQALAEGGNAAASSALAAAAPEAAAEPPPRTQRKSGKIKLPDLGGQALRDPDAQVRLAHVQSIDNRKDADQVGALLARLDAETDNRVLALIVAVVGRLGEARHVVELTPTLEHGNFRVRANAVESIALLIPPEERRMLLRSLGDKSNRVRANAVVALWGTKFTGVREAFTGLAGSADRKDRISCIYAISQIGQQAAGLLNALMGDKDPEVAAKAKDCRRILGLEELQVDDAPVSATLGGARTGAFKVPADSSPAGGPDDSSTQISILQLPKKLSQIDDVIKDAETSRDTALRELADGYSQRVGKTLVAPQDIVVQLADVTASRGKLRHNKPETRAALQEKLLALGKVLLAKSVWDDADSRPFLDRVAAAEEALEKAKARSETYRKKAPGLLMDRRFQAALVAAVLLMVAVVVYLLTMPGE